VPAYLAAHFEAARSRHEPIQERQPGAAFVRQTFDGHATVFDRNNFIASLLQCFLQKAPREIIIIGN